MRTTTADRRKEGETISLLKELAWTVLGIALLLAIVDYFPIGRWLSSRSDTLWWSVLPWILIGLIWFFMIRMFRRRRSGAERN